MDDVSGHVDFGMDIESGDTDNAGYSSFSGWSTCAEDDYQVDLFDQDEDPISFLEGMESHHTDGPEHTIQQFEIVRRRRRVALRKQDESDEEEGEGEDEDKGQSEREDPGDTIMEEGECMKEVQAAFEQRHNKIGKNRKRRRRRPKTGEKGKPRRFERKVKTKDEEYSRQMGEATFLFVNGKHEEAQALCMQVIKKAPNSPEPYHTMGMILEADSNTKRALDFYMVAAHFTPKDVNLWKRLAGLSTEVGYLRQAIYCLSHVIRHDRHDVAPQWDRALLYAEVNELYKAANAFEDINKFRNGDPDVAKMLAKLYHRMGRVTKAIKLLETFILEYEKNTDLTHINMLGELYLRQCNYAAASELINKTTQEVLKGQQMPIDLEAKAGICAAHTGDMLESDKHLHKLLNQNPAHYMDLFMDAGNNLLQLGYADRASEFFEPLLKVPQAAGKELWSGLRECRMKSGGMAAVTQMYKEIVQSLPNDHDDYADRCLLMMEAMIEVGDLEDAEEALESFRFLIDQDKVSLPASNEEASSMLLRMENIDLRVGQGETFLERMLPVVSASVEYISRGSIDNTDFNLPVDLHKAFTKRRRKRPASSLPSDSGFESDSVFKGHVNARRQRTYNRLMSEGETDPEDVADVEEVLILKGLLKQEDQFQILMKVIDALVERGRNSDACSILESLVHVSGSSTRLCNKALRDQARFKLVSVLMEAKKEYGRAHDHIKMLSSKHPYSIKVWNMYSQVVGKLGSVKWLMRYIDSIRAKHPSSTPVALMLGHVMNLHSYFSGALGEYFQVYKKVPNDPLVLLLIGVTYISLSMTPKVQNRHLAVLDGLAFLQQYGHHRGNEHEFLYNMGRATHQLGLVHLAVNYYEQALATSPPMNEANWRMEAAHNLVLIFKESGAEGLARDVTMKHLVI